MPIAYICDRCGAMQKTQTKCSAWFLDRPEGIDVLCDVCMKEVEDWHERAAEAANKARSMALNGVWDKINRGRLVEQQQAFMERA